MKLIKKALTILILISLGVSVGCSQPTQFNSNLARGLVYKNAYTIKGEKNFWKGYPAKTFNGMTNAVIEIPTGTNAKWEVNEHDGTLQWEHKKGIPRMVRYISYVGNYGMIPQTLLPKEEGGDGDPLDILILGPALPRGLVVPVKVIGMLKLLDRGEQDDKLIGVPASNSILDINSLKDLKEKYPGTLEIIQLWFQNYKGPGKMETKGFAGLDEAQKRLLTAIEGYKRLQNPTTALN